jgi:hypothetical protein
MIVLERLAPPVPVVAIDFDDQSGIRPVEVDGVRSDSYIDIRRWNPVAPADAEEPALSLAAGVVGDELAEVELEVLRLAGCLAVKAG